MEGGGRGASEAAPLAARPCCVAEMMKMMRAELRGEAGGAEVFRTPRRAAVYLNPVKRRAAFFCCGEHAFVLVDNASPRGSAAANRRRNAAWGQSTEPMV